MSARARVIAHSSVVETFAGPIEYAQAGQGPAVDVGARRRHSNSDNNINSSTRIAGKNGERPKETRHAHAHAAASELANEARPPVSAEERYRMICEAAYLRYKNRGETGGQELDDWPAAEAEIEALLKAAT